MNPVRHLHSVGSEVVVPLRLADPPVSVVPGRWGMAVMWVACGVLAVGCVAVGYEELVDHPTTAARAAQLTEVPAGFVSVCAWQGHPRPPGIPVCQS